LQYGQLIMVTGGARSGKSRLAEELAATSGRDVVYLATATINDIEMAARVARHQQRRPATWRTVEVPLAVAEAVAREGQQADTLLLDSLGVWLSNLLNLDADGFDNWEKSEVIIETIMVKIRELVKAAREVKARVIIVTEEVGLGLVPFSPLGRVFRDLLGLANEEVARQSNKVYLVVAGLPLVLKNDRHLISSNPRT